jgi:hypothetical protein
MKRNQTNMLTARTFAKEKGVSYTTIMAWLRDGLIPDAAQEETPMGMVWQIPASSLGKVERRKPGPKPATDTGDNAGQFKTTAAEPAPPKPKRKASKNSPARKANVMKSAKKKGARAK